MKFPTLNFVFILLNCVLSQNIENKIDMMWIRDCYFLEANSIKSVELICFTTNETTYPKDDCYSKLFKQLSQFENRLKVQH